MGKMTTALSMAIPHGADKKVLSLLVQDDGQDSHRVLPNETSDEDDDTSYLSTDCDSIIDAAQDEEETLVARVLVKAAFSRKLPQDVISRLLNSIEPVKKKQRVDMGPIHSQKPWKTQESVIRLSQSAPSLIAVVNSSPPSNGHKKADAILFEMIQASGYCSKTVPALSIKNFFLDVTEERIEAYDFAVVNAVRMEDIDALRSLKESGRSLECCNKFGESVIHAASRRGAVLVLKYLLDEGAASCKVICDSGRTPLHDACWTSKPNFEVIDVLLDYCPDLLYVEDKRGFTPLAYVSPDQVGLWYKYLQLRGIQRLLPKILW